jgi:excisionase family DNA binding protein
VLHNPVRVARPAELVNADEMADRLGLTRPAFDRLVRDAGVPKLKLGHRTVRFEPEAVIAFVTERFTTASPTP